MVISDHGFTSFRRGVNMNTWLKENGYLHLKEGADDLRRLVREGRLVAHEGVHARIDGLFVNRVGREREGIVKPGAELDALCHELKAKLEALRDPKTASR
jgi:predicted AlkP superfamily phosphohydrolase/phosphomutase